MTWPVSNCSSPAQCAERILNKIANVISKTFAELKWMLQRLRIYFAWTSRYNPPARQLKWLSQHRLNLRSSITGGFIPFNLDFHLNYILSPWSMRVNPMKVWLNCFAIHLKSFLCTVLNIIAIKNCSVFDAKLNLKNIILHPSSETLNDDTETYFYYFLAVAQWYLSTWKIDMLLFITTL